MNRQRDAGAMGGGERRPAEGVRKVFGLVGADEPRLSNTPSLRKAITARHAEMGGDFVRVNVEWAFRPAKVVLAAPRPLLRAAFRLSRGDAMERPEGRELYAWLQSPAERHACFVMWPPNLALCYVTKGFAKAFMPKIRDAAVEALRESVVRRFGDRAVAYNAWVVQRAAVRAADEALSMAALTAAGAITEAEAKEMLASFTHADPSASRAAAEYARCRASLRRDEWPFAKATKAP